jgi:hypothetical protein
MSAVGGNGNGNGLQNNATAHSMQYKDSKTLEQLYNGAKTATSSGGGAVPLTPRSLHTDLPVALSASSVQARSPPANQGYGSATDVFAEASRHEESSAQAQVWPSNKTSPTKNLLGDDALFGNGEYFVAVVSAANTDDLHSTSDAFETASNQAAGTDDQRSPPRDGDTTACADVKAACLPLAGSRSSSINGGDDGDDNRHSDAPSESGSQRSLSAASSWPAASSLSAAPVSEAEPPARCACFCVCFVYSFNVCRGCCRIDESPCTFARFMTTQKRHIRTRIHATCVTWSQIQEAHT